MMNREEVQDLLDNQASSLLEEMHALGKRITRLEELLGRSPQLSPPATPTRSFNPPCGQSTPPTVTRISHPSSQGNPLLAPCVLGHICVHLVPFLHLFQRIASLCKASRDFVSTQNKAAWSAMVAAHCGETHVVPSVPKYITHRENRPYLYRLHLRPWSSTPNELYGFAAIEAFLDDLETRDDGPTVHVQYIDRIGVVTRKRSPESKPHTRLILAVLMESVGKNMRRRKMRITLSVPLARSAQTYETPDIVKQKEFIPWPDEELGYTKLLRTTEALVGRLRANRVLPHPVQEALRLVEPAKDQCGLGYTKIHAHAFALYGIHRGARLCPIYIFSADCARLLARLPIFQAFEHTRLTAYGPFLFQTTRDGIDCYGPNEAMAFRVNSTDNVHFANEDARAGYMAVRAGE